MNLAGRILRCCNFGIVLNSSRFASSFHQGIRNSLGLPEIIWSQSICKTSLPSYKQITPLTVLSDCPRDGSTRNVYDPPVHGKKQKCILPPELKKLPLLYISPFAVIEIKDPELGNAEIKEAPTKANTIIEKRAERMMVIRKRKMKVHRRKKWRLKFKFVIQKQRFQKAKRKEKAFQDSLINKIQMAEAFNAEEHVRSTLKRIRERPRPETIEEKRARILELVRKNKSNVWVIPPKYEDD